jgi:hypothetical protein
MLKKAALSVVSIVAAGAVSTVPASAVTRPQVFSLVDVGETQTPLDPGATLSETELPRLGSRFTFTDGLYKWAGRKRGARVGRLEGICTFTKIEPRVAVTTFCTASWFLPAGRILGQAFIRFSEDASTFRVAVIGGTGAYAGARGFVKVHDLRSGNSNNEFHLLP